MTCIIRRIILHDYWYHMWHSCHATLDNLMENLILCQI